MTGSLAGQTFTQDAAGTLYGCHANFYGGGGFLTTPSQPDLTRHEEHTPYTGGCAAPGTLIATLHGYDSSGVPITNTDGDNHLGCTSGSTQYSACATYDNLDTHLLTATNAKNQSTTYSYDTQQESPEAGFGQWLMSTTDVNGQTTTYQYDALGRLTAIINPGDSVSSPSVTYTYINTCSAGKTTPCLELDTSTRFTVGGPTTTMKQWYDGWGRLVETQTPGPNLFSHVPAIPSLLVTYTVYDNMGRATTKSLSYAVAATAGLGYVAPDLNQPRTVTAYDSLGRSLGTATYSNTSTIVTKSSSSYTVAQGVATLSSENNNAYEQTITLDAYNHQSVSYTDGLGRTRFSQVDSGTGSPYSVVRTVGKTYDVVGNTLAVTTYDSTGTAQASYSATYDGLGRLQGFNDSDLGSCANTPMPADCSSSTDLAWKYSYDGDGNQLSQTDPRNQSTFMTYDAVDRPLCSALTSADAASCSGSTKAVFFYDGYSNASTPGATFPSGCVAPTGAYASDPVGEKTAEIFVGTNGAGSGWRCYGYDQRGHTDQSTLSVTTPDAGTVTQTMNVTYNDGGEVTGLVYPDGETLTPTYDVNGRLHSIYFGTPNSTDPVPFLIGQVSYTNAGQITSMAIGGSAAKASIPTPVLSSSTTYDGIQRPLSTSATVAGQTIWQQTRTYDNVGNILGLSATLPAQGGGTVTENESFCYDALNRLVWAGNSGTPTGGDHCMTAPTGSTLSAYAQFYSYDNLDRITSSAAGTYTYGDTNQVHAVTSVSSVPNPYAAYDAMGNMTCRNVDTTSGHTCAGSTPTGATMSYDAYGQLTSWNAPSGTVGSTHYLYDNAGNRVLTNASSASGTTDTIYFDSYTETVLSGGTTTTTKYYNAGGACIAMRVGATLSYLLSDPLGSNTVALNSTGQVIAVQHYRPYGTVDYSWGTMPTSYNYTGQRLDSQTGLLYYNFRYYDPVAGRFVRADTVQGNSVGMDSYAYVSGNPETQTDPTGHSNDPYAVYMQYWVESANPTAQFERPVPNGGQPDVAVRYSQADGTTRGVLWDFKTGGGLPQDPAHGTKFPEENYLKYDGVPKIQRDVVNARQGHLGTKNWEIGNLENDPDLNQMYGACLQTPEGCLAAFNDGTILRIKFDPKYQGMLQFKVERKGDNSGVDHPYGLAPDQALSVSIWQGQQMQMGTLLTPGDETTQSVDLLDTTPTDTTINDVLNTGGNQGTGGIDDTNDVPVMVGGGGGLDGVDVE